MGGKIIVISNLKRNMKNLLAGLCFSFILFSCGGALDGDATTDTTTMPIDTNINNPNASHYNRADGPVIDTSLVRDTIP
jgi:hypothetical protein